MSTVCGRPQWERGSVSYGQVRGSKSRFPCGRHKYMTPMTGLFGKPI